MSQDRRIFRLKSTKAIYYRALAVYSLLGVMFDGLVLWERMLVSSAVGPCLKEKEVINRITSSTPHKPVAGIDAKPENEAKHYN